MPCECVANILSIISSTVEYNYVGCRSETMETQFDDSICECDDRVYFKYSLPASDDTHVCTYYFIQLDYELNRHNTTYCYINVSLAYFLRRYKKPHTKFEILRYVIRCIEKICV